MVLDAEGEAMLAGLRAGASVVTPNEREAEELVGQEFADRGDLAHGLSELVRLGAGEAVITRPDGCVAVVGEGAERRFLEVAPSRWSRSRPSAPATPSWPATSPPATRAARPSECLAFGVACGAESTQHFGAGIVDPNQVERILPAVEVRDLEVPVEV